MGFFFELTTIFNSLSTELMWFIMLLFCFFLFLFFKDIWIYRNFYLFCTSCNCRKYSSFKNSRLFLFTRTGSIRNYSFASTFLCTDILSEYYGKEKARMNILIGFSAFLFMTLLMVITIGFQPSDADWVQESLSNVFTPMTRFFIASMIAYLISQYFDVWFYNYLKQALSGKSLWLRNNLSTIISSLVDNTVFSIFAWILLNPEPVSVYNVIMIYILGTYLLRIFIALLDYPFCLYSLSFLYPKTNDLTFT